jgi:peptidoglycan/LPS O-acetylase OafA/YrhL
MNKTYYPTINLLRGLAALLVCIYHFTNYSDINGELFDSGNWLREIGHFGKLGVFVFFIITGFVIPLSLMKHSFQIRQLPRYIAKRWIRIEIPYLGSIFCILLISLAFCIVNEIPFTIDLRRFLHHLFYTAPFAGQQWYNPIYWTLAIEMQFYLLIALLFPLISKNSEVFKFVIPLLIAVSALIITDDRIVLHYGAIFSQGILLLLWEQKKINSTLGMIGILIAAVLTALVNGIDVAIACILTITAIKCFVIDKPAANNLGKISYSLYLLHGLIGGNIIYFFGRNIASFPVKVLLVVIAILFSILGSYIYWLVIEKPSQTWSKKFKIK